MICEECGNNVSMGYAQTTGHKPWCSEATIVDKDTLEETDEDLDDFDLDDDEDDELEDDDDDENNPDGEDTE